MTAPTTLGDAVARVRQLASVARVMDDNETAATLTIVLAALPTPEEREAILNAADPRHADYWTVRTYLHLTRTGGPTDG